MKTNLILVSLLVLFGMLAASASAGVTINREGPGGMAQISVTTGAAVKVYRGDQQRYRQFFSFSVDVHCAYGDSKDAAPAIAPTSAVGLPFLAAAQYSEKAMKGTPADAAIHLRMDCIADSVNGTASTREVQ